MNITIKIILPICFDKYKGLTFFAQKHNFPYPKS